LKLNVIIVVKKLKDGLGTLGIVSIIFVQNSVLTSGVVNTRLNHTTLKLTRLGVSIVEKLFIDRLQM